MKEMRSKEMRNEEMRGEEMMMTKTLQGES